MERKGTPTRRQNDVDIDLTTRNPHLFDQSHVHDADLSLLAARVIATLKDGHHLFHRHGGLRSWRISGYTFDHGHLLVLNGKTNHTTILTNRVASDQHVRYATDAMFVYASRANVSLAARRYARPA
jgi:hypothetical protein